MAPRGGTLLAELGAVVDPLTGLRLKEVGMLRDVKTRRRRVHVALAVPVRDWPQLDELVRQLEEVVRAQGPGEVEVAISVMDESEQASIRSALRRHMEPEELHGGGHGQHAPTPAFLLPGSRTRVIGISSGKGGVGKSSVTVNLAVALAGLGYQTAILDADVYGFSVPKMLVGTNEPIILGDLVIPTAVYGVRCLSMGYFVEEDQPVIWRGPMLHKAIEQFLGDAYWGEPEFLLVDTPPGTGDVTLSLAQVMPRTEMLIVTTPQQAAQRVAQRAAYAARKLKLSVRGVIENMSWFTAEDGRRYELFGRGGGAALAQELGVTMLGQIPLVPALREGGDEGVPVTVSDPGGEAALAFRALAEQMVAQGPARVYRRELSVR